MLSLRLNGNTLELKFESYVGSQEYKKIVSTFSSLPGAFYWEEKYTWLIPKEHIDIIVSTIGEDNIAWHTSLEEIKGIQTTVLPEFTVSTEGLEDLKLTPYPFQAIGISFLHDVKRGLLADEMGLGRLLKESSRKLPSY